MAEGFGLVLGGTQACEQSELRLASLRPSGRPWPPGARRSKRLQRPSLSPCWSGSDALAPPSQAFFVTPTLLLPQQLQGLPHPHLRHQRQTNEDGIMRAPPPLTPLAVLRDVFCLISTVEAKELLLGARAGAPLLLPCGDPFSRLSRGD